ncbi:Cacna1g [Symbiodinium sp. CCMP2456]|nr:Cacna1g [Symbiodinium sp. CCMP2456]
MVDQVIRDQCESKKDMPPLSIDAFLTKLHTTHSHLQKAVLTELTCSENVWKCTLTRSKVSFQRRAQAPERAKRSSSKQNAKPRATALPVRPRYTMLRALDDEGLAGLETVGVQDVRRVREDLLKLQFRRLDAKSEGCLRAHVLTQLGARFGETLLETDVARLCRQIEAKGSSPTSPARSSPGVDFEGFCSLMSPEEEEEELMEDSAQETLAAVRRAVRAEAKEKLQGEQDRKLQTNAHRMRGICAVFFDVVSVLVIIANALVMGFSTDVSPTSSGWDVAELGFFAYYTLEYVIKLRLQGCFGYYFGEEAAWNWFDNACLVVSFVELLVTYIADPTQDGQGGFMLMRMLRLARLARLVRLMRFRMFRELKLMVLGLFSGLRALCWAIVLLMFIIYTIGVLMRLVSDVEEFGSMPRSMFTLFRCFGPDGCAAYDGTPLPERLRLELGMPFFVLYILTTMTVGVGLFNLIMAVFLDNVLKSQGQRKMREIGDSSAAVCTDLQLHIRRFLCEPASETERGLFDRLSESAQQKLAHVTEEGYYRDQATKKKIAEATYQILQEDQVSISKDMFTVWLQDPEFVTMLEEADVDMSDKFRMFDILDVDMGGELSADELVTGLMQLRGDVSKADIVAIQLKVSHLTYVMEEIQETLKDFCPAVMARLRWGEDDLATKLAAVEALRTQGPCALQHAMAVGTALLDVDEDVRELAALTLLSVEFPDGEALSPASESTSPEVQSPSEKAHTSSQRRVRAVQGLGNRLTQG